MPETEIVLTAIYGSSRSLTPDELESLKDTLTREFTGQSYIIGNGKRTTSGRPVVTCSTVDLNEHQRPSPAYLETYPLDTPGRVYETIADRIRAGEAEDHVLADMGLCRAGDEQRIAEAARAFAAVTAGLKNTPEGAALLAALEVTSD